MFLHSCGLQIPFMRICRPFLIYPVFILSGFYSVRFLFRPAQADRYNLLLKRAAGFFDPSQKKTDS
jgi:hypothetical protein